MQTTNETAPSLARLQRDFFRLPAPARRAEWLQHRAEMRVHTRGEHPGTQLLRRHLTEDEDCHRWRLDNFVPITRPAMQRALAQLARLFEAGSYAIEGSTALENALQRHRFQGLDFMGFVQQRLLPRMIEDPNAWLVWTPAGPGLTDPAQPVEVRPLIVDSDRIHYLSDSVMIFLSEEKSMVDQGDGPAPVGNVYYWLTPDAVLRYVQHGRAYERNYRLEVVYRHQLGELCGFPLGGVAREADSFESFFARFLPFAHEAIRQFSDWQVVTASNAYPVKEMRVTECDQTGCRTGAKDCEGCGGQGFVVRTGPFAALIRPEPNSALGEVESDVPMLRYITPPTEILRYAQQAWEALLDRAEDSICLRQPREPQSGTAKAYDREELHALLEQIGRHVMDGLVGRSLWMIERLLQPFAPQPPRATRRAGFRPEDRDSLRRLWQEDARKGPARGAALPALMAWADSQHAPGSSERRFVQLVAQLDPLSLYALDEQQELLRQGVITPEELRRSVLLPHRLGHLLRKNGPQWLLEASIEEVGMKVAQFDAVGEAAEASPQAARFA